MCVFPVQIVNHSVSNVEFEWTGMESLEGANISIEPTAGSVGASPSTASDQSIHMYIYGIMCIRTLHSLFVVFIVLSVIHHSLAPLSSTLPLSTALLR